MRKIHSLGLVGAVALVLAAVVAPAANGAVSGSRPISSAA